MRTTNKKLVVAGAVAALVAASGSAFTNSNTVEATLAGQGTGAITGYDVTDISYTYAAGNGATTFDKVQFRLDKPATRVEARIAGASTSYAVCTPVTVTEYYEEQPHQVHHGFWTCDLQDVVVADGLELDVFATDNATAQLP